MNTRLVEIGQVVFVNPQDSQGLLAMHKYMKNRKGERAGVITAVFDPASVPLGHSAAWVKHDDDGTVAPYWYHELERVERF